MNIPDLLQARFETALESFSDRPAEYAAMIKPSRFGDFQAECALPLARETGGNPRELAQQIIDKLDVADVCEPPEIAGPGFINLNLKDGWLAAELNNLASDDRLGVAPSADPKTIIIDYSAPNVAKPMHVGHLRSSVIGAALYNVLGFLGHKIVGDNHIGDWGTQFGMIIYGWKHFRDDDAYAENAVGELARLYRLVNQLSDYHAAVLDQPKLEAGIEREREVLASLEAQDDASEKKVKKQIKKQRSRIADLEATLDAHRRKIEAVDEDDPLKSLAADHPHIAREARNETARLHAGDEENRRLWEQFLPVCLEALEGVYERLDVRFDLARGESWYQPLLADVVADLETSGIASRSEGAMCVFLENNDAPFIVQKADGAFTYATTDLATVKNRIEELEADVLLYVVDARQSEHFKLLFGTIEKWGKHVECRHVSFGTILGEDKRPFKTRSGDAVGLESLLDESVARAREIVDANDDLRDAPILNEDERAKVAEIVGVGGIKYADLHHNRESDYVFAWDKMLAKTGDTATYMQYSYSRIEGIFRELEIDRDAFRNSNVDFAFSDGPEQEAERDLALWLLRFPEAIAATASELRPNLLTQYLFETANSFSRFYEKCHIKNQRDETIRRRWLFLSDLTSRVIQKGLELLGIETVERM